MRKIIDGKLYDTDKAVLLCVCSAKCSASDEHYCSEYLYRSPGGRYFMHACGNRLSKYAAETGTDGSTGYGTSWRILDEESAKKFVEENGTVNEYITAFGMPEEG